MCGFWRQASEHRRKRKGGCFKRHRSDGLGLLPVVARSIYTDPNPAKAEQFRNENPQEEALNHQMNKVHGEVFPYKASDLKPGFLKD